MAASVCKTVSLVPWILTSLVCELKIPLVAVLPSPRALPIAITVSPTWASSELPNSATCTFLTPALAKSFNDTEITARSALASLPTSLAETRSQEFKEILTVDAPEITWLFVTM